MSHAITSNDLKIHIHHIGGIGDIGPAQHLNHINHVEWTVYDADEASLHQTSSQENWRLLNYCIGKDDENAIFNVAKVPSASSLLKSDPDAQLYTFSSTIWGPHTQIVKKVPMRCVSLNTLREKENIHIDVLSVDAQGAELDILQGADWFLKNTTLSLVTEVEFEPIYEKQPLFSHQFDYLKKFHFRLCQIHYFQNWNIRPYDLDCQGNGYLTVGEAMLMKDAQKLIAQTKKAKGIAQTKLIIQCIKLAIINLIMDQIDVTIFLTHFLQNDLKIDFEKLYRETEVLYITLLNDILITAENIHQKNPYKPTQSYMNTVIDISEFEHYIIPEPTPAYFERKANGIFLSKIATVLWRHNLKQYAEWHESRYIYNVLSSHSQLKGFRSYNADHFVRQGYQHPMPWIANSELWQQDMRSSCLNKQI